MTFGAMCIALGWVLGGTIAKSPLDLYVYYGVIAGTVESFTFRALPMR